MKPDHEHILPRDWKMIRAIDQKNRKPGLMLKKARPQTAAIDRRRNKYKKQKQSVTLAKHA